MNDLYAVDRELQNEQLYLSSIIQDNSLIDESILTTNHFIKKEHKNLFSILQKLKKENEPTDIIRLSQLDKKTLDMCGGFTYIGDLAILAPSPEPFKRYEKAILTYWTIKQAERSAKAFLSDISNGYDLDYLNRLTEQINLLDRPDNSKKTFQELLYTRLDEHNAKPKDGLSGVDTGFECLNQVTDGWQNSELIIIGARPSMGKTALMLSSAIQGQRDNIFSTIFSLEMSDGLIIDRMIGMIGGINIMKMRNPKKYFNDEDWNKYSKATGILGNMNFDIAKDFTVQEMRATLRRNMKDKPESKHVVMIDFLTLIRTESKQSRNHEIEQIVMDLKKMATDFNIPVIVLSQLSRGLETRQNKRPQLSDLRESGAIEQLADLVMFLYRDDYYDHETEKKNIIEINVAKNRNGAVGLIEMKFIKETNTFREVI